MEEHCLPEDTANILSRVIGGLPEGRVVKVVVGLFLTAVEVECRGARSCGLAATLANPEFGPARLPAVKEAGSLAGRPALELARWVHAASHTEAAIGLAAVNALLPPLQHSVDVSAEELIARHGAQSRVALVGHFPFVSQLREQVRQLWVLELEPGEGDLPANRAAEFIPQADILAITATTLINHTFEALFALRKPEAKVMLLGPSTPLAPILLQQGIHFLSGSLVEDPARVVEAVSQAATYRQLLGRGVRQVTIGDLA